MDRMNGAVVKNESRYLTGRNHEEGFFCKGQGFPRNQCIVLHRKKYIYICFTCMLYT